MSFPKKSLVAVEKIVSSVGAIIFPPNFAEKNAQMAKQITKPVKEN